MNRLALWMAGAAGLGALAWLWWRQRQAASSATPADSSGVDPLGTSWGIPQLLPDFTDYTGGLSLTSAITDLGGLTAPRGIRNNNPGNIRKSNTAWVGLAPADQQTDPDFFVFSEGKYGLRAIAHILLNKQARGLVTVRQMISGPGGWAPTGTADKNPATYANFVANAMGVDVDQPVTLSASLPLLESMVAAIVEFENGEQPYASSYLEAAVQL